jgi:exosome complex component CSL4
VLTSSYSQEKTGEGKRIIAPGEPLAVPEEYDPGSGTYVDPHTGLIRSAVPGIPVYDEKARVVYVKPVKLARAPRAGSSVVGVVTQIRHDLVAVDNFGEVAIQPRPQFLYEYSSKFSGAIPVANIAEEYVKDIEDYFRVGDVVLAKVLNNFTPYHLTTVPPQYGVLYAKCSRCGHLMEPLNNRNLKCPKCGRIEKRKVSALATTKLLAIAIKYGLVVPFR